MTYWQSTLIYRERAKRRKISEVDEIKMGASVGGAVPKRRRDRGREKARKKAKQADIEALMITCVGAT